MPTNDFHPDPTLAGWNYNYLDGTDTWWRCIWDYRMFNMFADAVAERFSGHPVFATSPPAEVAHATSGDLSLAKWGALYNAFVFTFYSGNPWYRNYDATFLAPGDGPSIADLSPIVLPVKRTADYTSPLLQGFPYTTATTAQASSPYLVDITAMKCYYPREVTSITAPGTNGQFARFVQSSGAAGSNSGLVGKILASSGGASWSYDTNRNEVTSTAHFGFPDVLDRQSTNSAEYDPDNYPFIERRLQSGDYFCAAWLQAFRDLINETVCFYIDNSGENAGVTPEYDFCPHWSAEGTTNSHTGNGTNEATTNAAYAVGGTSVNRFAPGAVVSTDSVGRTITKHRTSAYPKVDNLVYSGHTRTVSILVPPVNEGAPFNAFGDNVSIDHWTVAATSTTSGSNYTGPLFGSNTAPVGSGGASQDEGYGIPNTGSFANYPTIGMVVRCDVSGGFAYTVST